MRDPEIQPRAPHAQLKNAAVLCLTIAGIFLPYYFTGIIILGVSIWILLGKNRRKQIFVHPGSRFLIPFWALACLTGIFHKNWLGLICTLGMALLLIIGLWARRIMTTRIYEQMLDFACYLSIPLAPLAVLEQILLRVQYGGTLSSYRSVTVFFNSNYFATIAATVIIICAHKVSTHQGRHFTYFGIAALNFISAYTTGSIFVWVEIFFGVAAIFYVLRKRELLTGLLLGSGLFILLVYFAPNLLLPRHTESFLTTEHRVDVWVLAYHSFLQSPLFGRGMLGYYLVSKQASLTDPSVFVTEHAHNLILDPLLNFGLIGCLPLLPYVACFLDTLVSKTIKRNCPALIAAVCVAGFLHGMTDMTLLWIQTGMLFLLILAGIDTRPIPIPAKPKKPPRQHRQSPLLQRFYRGTSLAPWQEAPEEPKEP